MKACRRPEPSARCLREQKEMEAANAKNKAWATEKTENFSSPAKVTHGTRSAINQNHMAVCFAHIVGKHVLSGLGEGGDR